MDCLYNYSDRCYGVGVGESRLAEWTPLENTDSPRLSYTSEFMLCILPQHHATG